MEKGNSEAKMLIYHRKHKVNKEKKDASEYEINSYKMNL